MHVLLYGFDIILKLNKANAKFGWFCHTLPLDVELFSFLRGNWMWGLASLLRECLERGKGKLEGRVNVTVNWVESVSFTRTNKPSQWSCQKFSHSSFQLASIHCLCSTLNNVIQNEGMISGNKWNTKIGRILFVWWNELGEDPFDSLGSTRAEMNKLLPKHTRVPDSCWMIRKYPANEVSKTYGY